MPARTALTTISTASSPGRSHMTLLPPARPKVVTSAPGAAEHASGKFLAFRSSRVRPEAMPAVAGQKGSSPSRRCRPIEGHRVLEKLLVMISSRFSENVPLKCSMIAAQRRLVKSGQRRRATWCRFREPTMEPLIQISETGEAIDSPAGGAFSNPAGPRPKWLKVPAPGGANYRELKSLISRLGLHTVCESAACPNVGDCWNRRTATFMILGNVCTRRLRVLRGPKGRAADGRLRRTAAGWPTPRPPWGCATSWSRV